MTQTEMIRRGGLSIGSNYPRCNSDSFVRCCSQSSVRTTMSTDSDTPSPEGLEPSREFRTRSTSSNEISYNNSNFNPGSPGIRRTSSIQTWTVPSESSSGSRSPSRSPTRGRPTIRRKRSTEKISSSTSDPCSTKLQSGFVTSPSPRTIDEEVRGDKTIARNSLLRLNSSERSLAVYKALEQVQTDYYEAKNKEGKQRVRCPPTVLFLDLTKGDPLDVMLFTFCVVCMIVTALGVLSQGLARSI
eukprot:2273686-Rhodomonas_salina.2